MRLQTKDGVLALWPERGTEVEAAFLFDLFAAAKAPETAKMPLDARGRDRLLRMQHESMTATYRLTYPDARFATIEFDSEPVGRIITDVGPRCVTYVYIALMLRVRNRGLATALMATLLDEPRRLGLPAHVTVLASNAASLRLWTRLDFAARADAPPPFMHLEWRAVAGQSLPSLPEGAARPA